MFEIYGCHEHLMNFTRFIAGLKLIHLARRVNIFINFNHGLKLIQHCAMQINLGLKFNPGLMLSPFEKPTPAILVLYAVLLIKSLNTNVSLNISQYFPPNPIPIKISAYKISFHVKIRSHSCYT